MGTRIPLSEVSLNHVRRNGPVRPPNASSQNGKFRPATPSRENDNLQKSSPIHSMLRNTTETGDVGQFSIRPSRIPSSLPRPSAGLSGRSQVSPSQKSLSGRYYNGLNPYDGRQTPSTSRQGPPSSNGSGTPKSSHEHYRRPRQPYRAPSVDDYRSYSMTQSSYINHSLTHRNPNANGHQQGRGDLPPGFQNPRPRSPFAYPTRLKRPGYRPSSPALSDLSRSMIPQSRGVYREPSTRTASPSSAYNMSRAPSPWQPGYNRSDPMLRFYPLNQPIVPSTVRSPSVSSTRPTTPKPSSSLRSAASSSRLRPLANDGWAQEQSLPDSAMFYDYTEAFEEPDLYHSVSMTTGILAEQTPPDVETDIYSLQDDSPEITDPAELPSNNSPDKGGLAKRDAPFNQNAFGFTREAAAWTQAPRQDLSDVLELPERELQSDHAIQDHSDIDYSHHDEDLSDAEHPENSSRTTATAENQLKPSDEDGVQETPLELASNASDVKLARGSSAESSPRTGSAFSGKSSPRLELREPTPEQKYGLTSIITPRLKLKIPSASLDNDEKPTEVNSAHPIDSLRAPSLEGHSGAEFTEVLSPTPERSIGSPSSRNRFSKILSIDEGLSELGNAVNSQRLRHDKNVPSQIPRPTSTVYPNGERLWRRRSSFFRDKPKQPIVTKNALAEVSDSEEEPELTSGLRATFCRPDGQIPKRREAPTPTPLQSKLPRRVVGAPINAQRAPAPADSIPELLKSVDESVLQDDNRDIMAPSPLPAPSKSMLETKQPAPVDKELPSTSMGKPAVKSLSPPSQPTEPGLPFSFTPLARKNSKNDSVAEPDAAALSSLTREVKSKKVGEALVPDTATRVPPDRRSAASPPGSRPWNLDASYPWDNQVPELEVNVPDDTEDPVPKLPRFKLRIHRASSSVGQLVNRRNSSDSSLGPFASSQHILHGPAFRRKRDPNLTIFPGQINSSHAVMRSSPQHTRFVESFETHSPVITLMPPSPGPGQEVRSFFSDDSSQMRPKGSLRKRFSDFKARIPRATSSDENRGYDRGLLSSALGRSRASGRSSRQSEHTGGASSHGSRIRHLRWKIVDRLKLWWHHREDKFRDWGWKMRYRRGRYRAASTPLYAGV